MEQFEIILGVLVLLAMIIIVYAYIRPEETARGVETSRGRILTTDIVIPLARDQYRSAYWAPAYVAGKSVNAIADTGSPYFIVPASLPCPKTIRCDLTGARTSITYGDGTKDNAVFAATHINLGQNHFPSLIFGGSEYSGTGSASANDPILGLAPLKSPPGRKMPVGASIVEQIGAKLVEFDLRDEYNAYLRLAPDSSFAKAQGRLIAEGKLMPRGELWALGVDHISDFYVVKLPPGQNPSLGSLSYLIIDTGTTKTLLPTRPSSDVEIRLSKGSIPVQRAHLGVLPPLYHGPKSGSLDPEVGIMGNQTMTGYRVVLDLTEGTCRFYR
jgi:hypothetical protein